MKLLLLSTGNMMAYKVLRCAAAAASDVFVFGDASAARLGASRFCRAFRRSTQPVTRTSAEALVPEINRLIEELGITMVIPGDYETSYVLTTIGARLTARTFPLPGAEVLERLNDKWAFNQLCRSMNIPAPESILLANKEEIPRALAANGDRRYVAKPLAQEGRNGFVDFAELPLHESVALIDYDPVLLQDYLPGSDICISQYCQTGEVRTAVVYTPTENSVTFLRHAQFERDAARIARAFDYTGVLCFDGRLSAAGEVSFIECNPRFWNNMDVAMVCGVNFVALGLQPDLSGAPEIGSGVAVRHLAFSPRNIIRPWLLSPSDVRFLRYRLVDYPFIWEMRKPVRSAA